jgi:hypothetical protein
MTNENEKADQKATDLAASLFGGLSPAIVNPLKSAKPLTGKFKIIGVVLKENDQPAASISIGMMGMETTTDAEGKFELVIEKK